MKNEKSSKNFLDKSNISHNIISNNLKSDDKSSTSNSEKQKTQKNLAKSRLGRIQLYSLDSIKKWLWKIFFQSEVIDEDKRRKEFILNVIICSFIIFLFLLSLLFIYKASTYTIEQKILSSLFFLAVWLPFLSLLYLSRKGYFDFAAYGLVGLFTLYSTLGAWEWGFDLPAVIISYLLIIAISSILFNVYIGMATTLFLAILIFSIGYYQIHIHLPNYYWRLEKPEMIDTITYAVELFFIMSISWL